MQSPTEDSRTSAEKMLAILLALGELGAEADGEVRLQDLVKTTGLPRPTVHRLLGQLRDAGFVSQETSGPYGIGPKILLLAAQALGGIDLQRVAGPVLQAFSDRVGHTVHLGIRDGLEVVYLAKAESSRGTHVGSRIGQRRPMAVTALGKALLAHAEDEVVERIIAAGWPRRTPNSLASAKALVAQLAEIRERGWAFDDEESDLGLRCAAAPIFDRYGHAVAAISVTTLVSQVDDREIGRLAADISKAAQTITAAMHGPVAEPVPSVRTKKR